MRYITCIVLQNVFENTRYDISIAMPANRTYRHAAKSRRILFAAREIQAPYVVRHSAIHLGDLRPGLLLSSAPMPPHPVVLRRCTAACSPPAGCRRHPAQQLVHGGSFLIWLHAAICALPVAVGTGLALVLAPAELHILGALVLDGQVPAVKLADQILERRVDAAGVPMELVTVKIIGDGNEAHTVQRENHFTDMDKTTNQIVKRAADILHLHYEIAEKGAGNHNNAWFPAPFAHLRISL